MEFFSAESAIVHKMDMLAIICNYWTFICNVFAHARREKSGRAETKFIEVPLY